MNKRFILAIALSIAVLSIWSAFVSKSQVVGNKAVTTSEPSVISLPAKPIETLAKQPEIPASSLFDYAQQKFDITFAEPFAAIKEVKFKEYKNSVFPLMYGLLVGDTNMNFVKGKTSQDSCSFVYADKDKQITKKFIFRNSSYVIDLELEIKNLSASSLSVELPIVLGVLDYSRAGAQMQYQDIAISTAEKLSHFDGHKDLSFSDTKFVCLRERYFCAILDSGTNNQKAFIRKANNKMSEVGIVINEPKLGSGQTLAKKFTIYLGPQDLRTLNSIKPEWGAIINFGMFDFISQLLLQLLEFLYGLVHNWGWAIILFSVAIFLVLFPLTLKQMRSMKDMQALQPKIEALRQQYKDNPQKLNKEMLELYKEHKVNPFGGCLPLILQLPIFFALYPVLMRSVALRGAKFLWIKDLSEPDKLFTLPQSLPILGNEINILPILMVIGMFLQQKISMVGSSGSSAEQQKIMLLIMPIMMGFIFYHMPSGLVLYWFINSTLMLIFQFKIKLAK